MDSTSTAAAVGVVVGSADGPALGVADGSFDGSSVGSARSPGKTSKKPAADRRSSGLYVDDSSRRSQEFEVEEDISKSPPPKGGAARWRATQSNQAGASPDALNRARAAAVGSPVPMNACA